MIRTRQGLSSGMKGLLILNLTFLKNYRKLFFKPAVSLIQFNPAPKTSFVNSNHLDGSVIFTLHKTKVDY